MLVSVVIPSYNHARYVRGAVESVLGQTYSKLELVVIDDGSRDESVSILSGIRDPRFTLQVQENRGAHAAINQGLSSCQGDYLAILNSDDLFHPQRLSECISFMDAHGVDVACSWIQVIDADGASKGIKRGWYNMRPAWANGSGAHGFWNGDDFHLNLLSTNFVSTTSNIVMRRSVYERVGGMRNLRYAHDWDFMLRAAADAPCGLVPQPLVQYRLHGANTISTHKHWMLFEVCWVLAANLHRFEGRDLYGPAVAGVEQRIAMVRGIDASIRVAGCDRLLWMLRQYIDARKRAGDDRADEELLADPTLRQAFIDLVAKEEPR